MPWQGAKKDGKQGHHLLPKKEQKKALGTVYDDTTTRITPKEHQKVHQDIREVGVIGSVARIDKRRVSRPK